jgi:hypothetical protein
LSEERDGEEGVGALSLRLAKRLELLDHLVHVSFGELQQGRRARGELGKPHKNFAD